LEYNQKQGVVIGKLVVSFVTSLPVMNISRPGPLGKCFRFRRKELTRSFRTSGVRVHVQDGSDYTPGFMCPVQAVKDRSAINKIQGCNPGDMFGRIVADPGVTLNGAPVQLLVCASVGQPRDLLNHHDLVERVGGIRQLARVAAH
jgi:hypothetical protein